jgi:DNA mismatch repair protein MutS
MAGPGNGNKTTPTMRQYFAAKAAHPDAILFFRLGDFYEMFYEDAVTAAKVLELTLTSRNKNAPDEVPMAGVPYHAAHGYIARLLARGYKVALCEQMGDPTKTKGVVPREVVRVMTPGLITDTDQLDARQNSFLAAIEPDADSFAVALLDLSTGELRAGSLPSGADLMGELARAAPRELLLGPVDAEARAAVGALLRETPLREDAALLLTQAREILRATLGAEEADAAHKRLSPAAILAAARAIRFAAACSPGTPLPIRTIEAFDTAQTLTLDEVAQKHLELTLSADGIKKGSLLELLDATCTPGGARLLRRRLLAPLLDVAQIRQRLDVVGLFVHNPGARTGLRAALDNIGDLERLAVRASLQEATPKDLGALRDSIAAVPQALAALTSIADPAAAAVLRLASDPIDLLSDLHAHLAAALVDRPPALAREGGIFRPGFDAPLDEYRDLQSTGTQRISELEARLRLETGATTLKVKYTRVFGWYIEVTGKHLGKVPPTWRRKQTVAGAERYTNEDLDSLSDKILHAEEHFRELEAQLYKNLLGRVAALSSRIHLLSARLSDWDAHAALAEIAHRFDYVRPEVDTSLVLDLVDARHPVVERMAAEGQFVPNDVKLEVEGERLWLITGPNMSGKSTLMRQVALIVIMAQLGSYVPARQARIGVVDRILSRVGASDNVARGESTFMVEMRETSAILRSATRRSLVILDEIGRGTSTYDGLAIAWAVAEHLHDVTGCRALFATHYHELTELTKQAKNAANYSVTAREFGDDIVFLHKLSRGAASRSYGIAVARLAGLPENVLARARSILESLESAGVLPGGAPATMRRRDRGTGKVQLDLFAPPPVEVPARHAALDTLRGLDPERLSPLDALQLLIKLKALSQS